MLHSYSFQNFLSFSEKAEISLVLSEKAAQRKWAARTEAGTRLNSVACFMGANAAGKTAALRALHFVSDFIQNSFSARPDAAIPVKPHFDKLSEPTEFEVQAEDRAGVVWRYNLIATKDKVLHESLYRRDKPGDRFKFAFVRDWKGEGQGYAIKQKIGFPVREALKVRANASLISTASQYGVDVARHISANLHIRHNLSIFGRRYSDWNGLADAAQLFANDREIASRMSSLLHAWDLGLERVDLVEMPSDPHTATDQKEPEWLPVGAHEARDGKSHYLFMAEESSGTQSAFVLLSHVLPVIKHGGLALIDEFDSDLHPLMLEPLLELFASPATNPHRGQLLFTCQTPEVLGLIEKSQVHFFEKNLGQSVAFRGDTIQGLRSDDNLRAKYVAGALGAVPRV